MTMLQPKLNFFLKFLFALSLLALNSCAFKPTTFYEIPAQNDKWRKSLSKEPIHIVCTYYRTMRYDTLHKARLALFKSDHSFVKENTSTFLMELCNGDQTLFDRFILYKHGEKIPTNRYYEFRHYEYVSLAYFIPFYRAKHSLCIELRLIENGQTKKIVRHWAFTRTNDHTYSWEISDGFYDLTRFSTKKAFLEMFN